MHIAACHSSLLLHPRPPRRPLTTVRPRWPMPSRLGHTSSRASLKATQAIARCHPKVRQLEGASLYRSARLARSFRSLTISVAIGLGASGEACSHGWTRRETRMDLSLNMSQAHTHPPTPPPVNPPSLPSHDSRRAEHHVGTANHRSCVASIPDEFLSARAAPSRAESRR